MGWAKRKGLVATGDPFGPVLFALGYMAALRKVLADHPGAVVPSFLDDTTKTVKTRVHTSHTSRPFIRHQTGWLWLGAER